jgi:hypothetical protein
MTRTLIVSLLAGLALSPAARAGDEPVKTKAKEVTFSGHLGYARTFSTPQQLSPRERRLFDEEGEGEGESEGDDQRQAPAPAGPNEPPTPEPLDVGLAARAATAGDEYTLFRSTAVQSGSPAIATGEPTVANDRNSLLYTGNKHAAVSSDNGMTWLALHPADKTYYPQYDNGFCCDQVAYAVDRGPNSLVFWLRQFRNDGTAGHLSLIIFQGRKELTEPELTSQQDYCEYHFKPADFGVANGWFDFNQVSNTKKYLYISSKSQQDSSFVDGIVWRMALDDLDDDNCGSIKAQYWMGVGTGFNSSLVQGAGNERVMHWAFPGGSTGKISFTRATDGSKSARVFTRSITPYLDTERPTATSSTRAATCVLPDATDPCQRVNDKINTGYRAPGEVGWFWNVRQGTGRPFPHIRGVRFTPGPHPTLISEPDIWNPNFAWIYPSVGVDARGHVGVLAYDVGGGHFPKATASLVDDVAPDTDWDSLSFHSFRTSTKGANTWGDYEAVRAYGDCPNTFAGAAQSMQTTGPEHRFVWFGRARDACPDLTTTAVSLQTTSVDEGGIVGVNHDIRNTGSALTPDSDTRFYWSQDALKSDDDLLTANEVRASGVAPGATLTMPLAGVVAPTTDGTYYLLACADGNLAFDEISDTNNCLAAPDTVVVGTSARARVSSVDFSGALAHAIAGARLRVAVGVQQPARGKALRVTVYLTARTAIGRTMTRLGSIRARGNAGGTVGRVAATALLRLPRDAPATRRRFLVACAGKPRADRCVVARRPLFVTSKH